MKTTELRIGNLVYGLNDENHSKKEVDKIAVINLVGWETMNGKTGIQPIELTGEWLEKLGCKPMQNGYFISLSSLKAEIHFEVYPYCSEIVSVIKSDFCNLILDRIYFVHQLQNLYFALSNEELPIK